MKLPYVLGELVCHPDEYVPSICLYLLLRARLGRAAQANMDLQVYCGGQFPRPTKLGKSEVGETYGR